MRGLGSVEEKAAAEKLIELVEEAGTPVVVSCHRNADPDAVSSAIVVRDMLRSKGFDARVVLPEGMNQASKRVVKEIMGREPGEVEDEPPSESAIVVVVDTASLEQLGRLASFVAGVELLVVIDHHSSNQLISRARLAIHDPGAKATAELVYLLAGRGFGFKLSKTHLELLLAGIVYDTRHLILSAPRTLRVVAEIVESGVSLTRVASILYQQSMDIGERIARMKAAMRMSLLRAGDYLIAVTRVGGYESSSARGLLELGADMAIVVSQRGTETRVTGRARKRIIEDLGLDLGRDIMKPLAEELRGGGGGHSQAAGATVNADEETVTKKIWSLLLSLLRDKGIEPKIVQP